MQAAYALPAQTFSPQLYRLRTVVQRLRLAPAGTIQFRQVHGAGPGGAAKKVKIAGRATSAKPGQRIVLFARDGTRGCNRLPVRHSPEFSPEHSWASVAQIGTEYAALLVERVAMLRPGGGSIDARLFGPKHFDIDRTRGSS